MYIYPISFSTKHSLEYFSVKNKNIQI